MLSFALWVKETHTWLLSRSILLVLIWAYSSFTRNYQSSSSDTHYMHSINHDHANALMTWAAWLVYSSVVELTPDAFPDSLGIVVSIVSVGCVVVSIRVENERHSKKDGLRRTDWIVLQTSRGLFVGLLFIPHRSTLFSLGAPYTAGVSLLFFVNFAIASMSTDIDQKAPLYVDCKLMQSVWVLVGDIRITALAMPYVLFQLNKIKWLKTGDGWTQHRPVETQHPNPSPAVGDACTELTAVDVVGNSPENNQSNQANPSYAVSMSTAQPLHRSMLPQIPPHMAQPAPHTVPPTTTTPPRAAPSKEVLSKLQEALSLSNNNQGHNNHGSNRHHTDTPGSSGGGGSHVTLFAAPSEHLHSHAQRTSLVSHLKSLSKAKETTTTTTATATF